MRGHVRFICNNPPYTMRLLLLCLLLSPAAFAQKNNQVKLSLLNFADNVNPGVEIGYERMYAGRWATQVSYTFLTTFGAPNFYSEDYLDFSGRRFIIEEKYYLRGKKEHRLRHYIAIDYTNLHADMTEAPEFRDAPGSYTYVRDTINISRRTYSFNARWGLQIYFIRERFVLDFTAGFGFKHRKVTVTGREAGQGGSKNLDLFGMYRNSDNWKFNVPLNVRLGYRF